MDNEQYANGLYKEDSQLEMVKKGIQAEGMPEISISPGYGRLLTMLVQMSGSKAALEIGALGGYSGICIARGLSEGGMLTSLELEQKYADVAGRHLQEAGLGGKVQYRVGDAKATLAALAEEGHRYDFFFIDADKEGYPVYLDWALKLAEPGAIIVGDNVLLRGRVTNEEKQGPSVAAMREFNKRIAEDERLTSTVLPGYDGLAIAVVNGR
ncbi:O-methyltransferase [Paenibacillus sp. GCM10023252]|uniref:O-methyltransferase n=1 Tax=Paenibacillus sp. GCM10023252 TaxID=3252649 RepID=UPI00362288CC